MTHHPFTDACHDCLPVVHVTRQRGLLADVLVAAVEHQLTCPWMARVAPESATVVSEHGILMHTFASPAESVGDER